MSLLRRKDRLRFGKFEMQVDLDGEDSVNIGFCDEVTSHWVHLSTRQAKRLCRAIEQEFEFDRQLGRLKAKKNARARYALIDKYLGVVKLSKVKAKS